MEHIVRLSKLTKIIGICTIGFFMVIVIAMLITGNYGAAICFAPFVVLGGVLLLAYKKQIIRVNENELVFSYLLKKTQHVRYEDIQCILVIPLNNRTQVALIDRQYRRITTLDLLLSNSEYLYEAFEKKQIELLNFQELIEQNQDVSKFMGALNWIERNYYKTLAHEDETVKEMSKSKTKGEVNRTKRFLKILGWILILANVAAYLIGGKVMVIILIGILLVTYALYIIYYPYIYIEVTTKKGQEQVYQLPMLGAAIAMLISLSISQFYNYDFGSFMKIMAGMAVLLAAPFIIKSSRTEVTQRFARKLSVFFAVLIMAFTLTFPVNFILTSGKATHETAVVTDKKISGGKTRDYDLYVSCNGEEEVFTVSRREYEDTSIGDEKRICMRKSVLGLNYRTVHD